MIEKDRHRAPGGAPAEKQRLGGASALKVRFLGVIVFELLLIMIFSLVTANFLSMGNGRSILYAAAILVIAAAGQTVVVLTGNLDLSVGSMMGLTAYVVYDIIGKNESLRPLVIVFALILGCIMGAVNGFLVAVLRIPSIVATLGTLAVYRGFVSLYAHAKEVTSGMLPGYMKQLALSVWLGLPAYVWIALAILITVGVLLQYTPWGREIYAYGSNPKAARYYGLSENRIVMGAYVANGVICAIAGILLGAQVGNINSLLSSGYEMTVLAAVVIGGVSITGGSGSVYGAAIGAIVLATINNGLVLLHVQEYYRLLIQGAAIVLAVGIDAAVRNRIQSGTSRRKIMEVDA